MKYHISSLFFAMLFAGCIHLPVAAQDKDNRDTSHAKASGNNLSGNTEDLNNKNPRRVGKDGFTGIYRMVRPKALNMNSGNYERGFYIEYITFLPDGNLFWALPPEGLLYFDSRIAQRAQSDNWGSYEFVNGEIHVVRGPAKKKYVITKTGDRLNNPPSLGKGSFRNVPSADGLRLDGKYRRNENEPAISFTTDGKFTDEGIFRFFGTIGRLDGSTYLDDGIGGSGTYVIDQNTLELKYTDGRIKRHVFIAFQENMVDKPAVKSFLLYEQRMERY